MGKEVREYEWQPGWLIIIFGGMFFALCTYVIAFKSAPSPCDDWLCDLFSKFSENGAVIYHWFLGAVSFAITIAVASLAYHRLNFQQRLAFRSEALVVPVSRWSHEEIGIAYRDIVELSHFEYKGNRSFIIKHKGGRFTISEAWLSSRAVFNEVCELLNDHVQEVKRTKLQQAVRSSEWATAEAYLARETP